MPPYKLRETLLLMFRYVPCIQSHKESFLVAVQLHVIMKPWRTL